MKATVNWGNVVSWTVVLLQLLPLVCSLSQNGVANSLSSANLQNYHAFTAIPPSPNPSSKLNRAFCQELQEKIGAQDIELLSGRFWFRIDDTSHVPPLNTWGSLFRTGVRSVRVVALDTNITSDLKKDLVLLEIVSRTNFREAIQVWKFFGNELALDGHARIHIRCRVMADATAFSNISSSEWSRQLALAFCQANGNWTPTLKRKDADLEMHLVLHQGNRVTLELLALVPSQTVGELPCPGFKRVESWAIAKSASIQPHNVVLDPMCGRGTFLVEAATFWPNARYFGLDKSAHQLEDARANIQSAQVNVELLQGDSTKLFHLNDETVDRIVCCPPFGRQFGVFEDTNLELYDKMLKEWARVLKERGKMVLVIDSENFDILVNALWKNGCNVDALRDFRLGKLSATIVVASKRGIKQQQKLPPRGKLPWEQGLPSEFHRDRDRGLWARLRANALPSLVPANPAQNG